MSDHAHFTNTATYQYLTLSFLTTLNAADSLEFSPTGQQVNSAQYTVQHISETQKKLLLP